jgi:hypothetical protein
LKQPTTIETLLLKGSALHPRLIEALRGRHKSLNSSKRKLFNWAALSRSALGSKCGQFANLESAVPSASKESIQGRSDGRVMMGW